MIIPKFKIGDEVKHRKTGFDGKIVDVKVVVSYKIKGDCWTVNNALESEIESGLFDKIK